MKKEIAILQFLESFHKEHQFPPTWEEVGYVIFGKRNAFGTVQWCMKRLEKRGLIKYYGVHNRQLAARTTLVVHPYSEIEPYLVKHLGYIFIVNYPPLDEIMKEEREREAERSDLVWVEQMKQMIEEKKAQLAAQTLDAIENG